MFVKVIKSGHESVYECHRFHKSNGESKLLITLENDCGIGDRGLTIEIDKNVSPIAIYVMNNEGKTIDTLFSNA